jgi:hypothetical protein
MREEQKRMKQNKRKQNKSQNRNTNKITKNKSKTKDKREKRKQKQRRVTACSIVRPPSQNIAPHSKARSGALNPRFPQPVNSSIGVL